jgi:purine-binding chemotaxis protein CheW
MTDVSSDSLQVVMVGLGDEILAVEASLVREIIDPVPATAVAGARPHLPAVINVRGNVIPLADLRVQFDMPRREATADTRIVVVEVSIDDEPVVVGIMADKVHEVTEISRGTAQPTPRVGMGWRPEYIRFIAKWNEDFIIVPDLERILN